MAALQIVGGLSASSGLEFLPLRPASSSSSQSISRRIWVFTYESSIELKSKSSVDARNKHLLRIAEVLGDACAYVRRRQVKNARISASLNSGEGKMDNARKALEQMFEGKTGLSKKWEEEIKKREFGERDGGNGSSGKGGGGRGWGGGSDDMDGDAGDQEEPWDWEEAGQTFMATSALILLYFSMTHGPKQVFRLFRIFFRWVRQGFTLKTVPREVLEGPDTDDEEDEVGNTGNYSDDERLSNGEPDVSILDAQTSHVQNNHESFSDAEMETMDEDSYLPEPPPLYKKESRMAALQAQQKERMMQMLSDRDRGERGK